MRRARVLLAAFACLAAACRPEPPLPGPFTRAEIAALTDRFGGAQMRAQMLYHYLKKGRDPNLPTPRWIDDGFLDAMLKHAVWQDPEEGVINEAQMWQAPPSILYEFFETTRKTFPPEFGGRLTAPLDLAAEYRDHRLRMAEAVRRLRVARRESSLQGRGQAVIQDLEKVSAEMDGLSAALEAKDSSRFKPAALEIARLTQDVYSTFQDRPR